MRVRNLSPVQAIAFGTLAAGTLVLADAAVAFAATGEGWPGAHSAPAFGDGSIRKVYCDLTELMQGTFGALLFSVAGLGAIIAAGLGNMKHSLGALMIGVAAFTFDAGIGFFFGDMCSAAANGGAAAQGGAGGQGDGTPFRAVADIVTGAAGPTDNTSSLEGLRNKGSYLNTFLPPPSRGITEKLGEVAKTAPLEPDLEIEESDETSDNPFDTLE